MDDAILLSSSLIRPDTLDDPGEWSGYAPFAIWLVQTLTPRVLVEFGTTDGTSYFSFCRSVQAAGLETKCFAVPTREVDGACVEGVDGVICAMRNHNELNYSDFSRVLGMNPDEAIAQFSDGSVELLHLDGFPTYAAVKRMFERWLPKLAPHAVVLLHNTNRRERGFDVWRFWDELVQRYPLNLELLHANGLGVLQLSAGQGSFAVDWLRPDAADRRMLTEYFGARAADALERANSRRLQRAVTELQAVLEERDAELVDLRRELSGHQDADASRALALDDLTAQMALLNGQLDARMREIASFKASAIERGGEIASLKQAAVRYAAEVGALANAAAERDAIVASPHWRLTRPLRALVGIIRRDPAYIEQIRNVFSGWPGLSWEWPFGGRLGFRSVSPAALKGAADRSVKRRMGGPAGLRVIYVSGEAHTPGHYYRVECYAEAAGAAGAICSVIRIEDIDERLAEIAEAQVVFIWRAVWSKSVERLIKAARAAAARLVFDVDDLMIDPNLARTSLIDGIRSQGLAESSVGDFYACVRRTMLSCDLCTVTTEELATHIRRAGLPVFVMPNGYDESTFLTSRLAARRRGSTPDDGLLRIGYAGGSRTHQRDFALCVVALAEVLRERPNVRLVLFRDGRSGAPLVDLHEFPALLELEDRVEWRDLVPVRDLPSEVARFDINLAPLEVGNPFCEAKSELKFFEAALVGVCTVASPTGPFRRAIRQGETGFLAETDDAWRTAFVRLLDDADLREQMARAALHDVLWAFGPERRVERMVSVLGQLSGGRDAARAFVCELQASQQALGPPPVVPAYETVFASDRLGRAEVTVVIPLYNYATCVEVALDSVARQTVQDLDLIVVDDASTDDGLNVVRSWAQRNAARFNRLLVLRNLRNAHLGPTRNVGFSVAETLYVLPLDADNRLLPDCLAQCLATIRASRVAYAYPVIQKFGASEELIGDAPYDVVKLVGGNYIDAMALISKSAWALVGGYDDVRFGWEDYDFWCRLAERGLSGVGVGGKPLALYQAHNDSMLRTTTDLTENKLTLVADIERRHPWLSVVLYSDAQEVDSAERAND